MPVSCGTVCRMLSRLLYKEARNSVKWEYSTGDSAKSGHFGPGYSVPIKRSSQLTDEI